MLGLPTPIRIPALLVLLDLEYRVGHQARAPRGAPHVRPASAPAAESLRASATYTLAESARGGPTARLPEPLLVECLRQYLGALPPGRTGWLAALRDPVVGRALALLHAGPADPWPVERLARRAGVSRTVLGERFVAVLGQPPAAWRALLRRATA
jgi:hypothetical protein